MTNKQPDPKQGSELDNKLDAIFMVTSTIYTDKYGEVTPFLVPMQYELELKRQLKVIIQTSVQEARIDEINNHSLINDIAGSSYIVFTSEQLRNLNIIHKRERINQLKDRSKKEGNNENVS